MQPNHRQTEPFVKQHRGNTIGSSSRLQRQIQFEDRAGVRQAGFTFGSRVPDWLSWLKFPGENSPVALWCPTSQSRRTFSSTVYVSVAPPHASSKRKAAWRRQSPSVVLYGLRQTFEKELNWFMWKVNFPSLSNWFLNS